MKHKQLAIDLWNVEFQKLTKYAPVIIKREEWGRGREGGKEREGGGGGRERGERERKGGRGKERERGRERSERYVGGGSGRAEKTEISCCMILGVHSYPE